MTTTEESSGPRFADRVGPSGLAASLLDRQAWLGPRQALTELGAVMPCMSGFKRSRGPPSVAAISPLIRPRAPIRGPYSHGASSPSLA